MGIQIRNRLLQEVTIRNINSVEFFFDMNYNGYRLNQVYTHFIL